MIAQLSWHNRTLAAVSQARMVNNLNDGLSRVIFSVLLVDHRVSIAGVGIVKALYPLVWQQG